MTLFKPPKLLPRSILLTLRHVCGRDPILPCVNDSILIIAMGEGRERKTARKAVDFYSVFRRYRKSGSHDHPSRARILTSAGSPFSNNLLVARTAPKRPRGTRGVVVDTAMTIPVPRVYCCPMTRPYLHGRIYASRADIARRRRKYARMRPGTGP